MRFGSESIIRGRARERVIMAPIVYVVERVVVRRMGGVPTATRTVPTALTVDGFRNHIGYCRHEDHAHRE